MKRILVAYYSRTGTTRAVAESIAAELGCVREEIVDRKNRAGLLGFVVAARDATLKRRADIEEPANDPAAFDLVVIGTPVWAWTMSCAVRAYLEREKDRLPQVAFFLTAGGTGAKSTLRDMEQVSGEAPAAVLALLAREVKKGAQVDKVRAFVDSLRG